MTYSDLNELKKRSWDRAIYAHGTAYIFNKRVEKYRRFLRAIAFLGILVPLSVGGTVLAYGTKSVNLINFVIPIASFFGIIQIILSGLSLSSKWDDEYANSLYSLERNTYLRFEWENLAKSDYENIIKKFDILNKEDQLQEQLDIKKGITEKEKRIAMRAGLMQYQRECISCNQIPKSMSPSDCETCGNF